MHVIIQCKQQFWILALCSHPLEIFLKDKVQIIKRIPQLSVSIISTQHRHSNNSNELSIFCNDNSIYTV